jgi:hypothetical protein
MVEARTSDGRIVELNEDGTWIAREAPRGPSEGSSFRRVNWGATRAEVQKSEGRSPDAEGVDALAYEVTIGELTATALYIFVADTLVRAKYLITQQHSNDIHYLRDFATLEELLTVKYGQPTEKNEYWTNDLYQDSPQEFGMAVSAGHMARFFIWTMADTTIGLVLKGDNYQIELGIEYIGRDFEDLENSERQKATLDDL